MRPGGPGAAVGRCTVTRKPLDPGAHGRSSPSVPEDGAQPPEPRVEPEPLAPAPPDADTVLEGEIVDSPLPEALLADPEAAADEALAAAVPEVILARGTGTLVRRDALSRYLAEIARFERLTPEEENRLALRYRDHGDTEAAARLVTSNLRLVVAVAFSFRRTVANLLDLVQEGNIGLMEAVERFDPARGARLSTYATWWIRSRIVKYLLDNWRLVRVGTTNARRKLLYNLQREKARLLEQGIEPTPRLLADRLGTSTEDVEAVDRALGASDVSLDAPVGDEGTTTRGELLGDVASATPEEQVAGAELRQKLAAVLAEFRKDLSPRDLALLDERLLADSPLTLQEIAAREGVTREAVRQSETRLQARLKAFIAERLPEAAEIRFQ